MLSYPPKEIIVRGYRYVIEYVGSRKEVDEELVDNHFVGQIIASNPRKIRIFIDMQPIEILDTIIHEILHAVVHRNPLIQAVIRPKIDCEAFISALACEIADILVRNNFIQLPEKVEPTVKRINNECN